MKTYSLILERNNLIYRNTVTTSPLGLLMYKFKMRKWKIKIEKESVVL